MKKIILICAAVCLLLPVSLFAAPGEEDISDTIEGVMTVYGLSIMASMFGGTIPSGTLTVDTNENTQKMTFHYTDFPARIFLEKMSSMMEEEEKEEMSCPFDTMSGTIISPAGMGAGSTESMVMDIDVQLKGGKIKKMEMRINEDGDITLVADGHRFADTERLFENIGD